MYIQKCYILTKIENIKLICSKGKDMDYSKQLCDTDATLTMTSLGYLKIIINEWGKETR